MTWWTADHQERVEKAKDERRRLATKTPQQLLAAAQQQADTQIDLGPVVLRWHHTRYTLGDRDWDTAVEVLAYALFLHQKNAAV